VKSSLVTKLESLSDRHEEVSALLSDAETASDPNKFRLLSQEYAQLDEVVKVYDGYRRAQEDLAEAKVMLNDPDADVREMAQEEVATAETFMATAEGELQLLMLPKDPKDKSNVFLEIRAGTGGDEAAIFSGDLFRCILGMRRVSAGQSKLSLSALAITVAIKKLLRVLPVRRYMRT
jgi:peptide chain release factor 1